MAMKIEKMLIQATTIENYSSYQYLPSVMLRSGALAEREDYIAAFFNGCRLN